MAEPGRMGFFRTTLVGGILFLIPVVVVIFIVEKALGLLDRVSDGLARALSVQDVAGIPAPRLLAVLLLVAICFVAGIVARTSLARGLTEHLENKLLRNIPGYAFYKRFGASLIGVEDRTEGDVILVRIEDAWQFGFLMERTSDGQIVAFVPGAPDASSGSVYVLTPDRIRQIDASMAQAVKCLHRLGRGSAALLRF
jgi:uncharacterized membrane protein